MHRNIDCFLPCDDMAVAEKTVADLRKDNHVQHIWLLATEAFAQEQAAPAGAEWLVVEQLLSTAAMKTIAMTAEAPYVLLGLKTSPRTLGLYALGRWTKAATDTGAAMVYADHYSIEGDAVVKHPVIDYQTGSLRDDFDFGSLLMIKTDLLQAFAQQPQQKEYRYAGYLYTEHEHDLRASGEKQFDYVNPRNREVQVEMEQAVTVHLAEVGGLVDTSRFTRLISTRRNSRSRRRSSSQCSTASAPYATLSIRPCRRKHRSNTM